MSHPDFRAFNNHYGSAISAWHERLTSRKGERAELRRAAGVSDVLACEAAHELVSELVGHDAPGSTPNDVFALAAVLAHVSGGGPTEASSNFFARLGRVSADNSVPLLKHSRFARLIRANSLKDRIQNFRRVLAIAEESPSVVRLAYWFLYWQSDDVKRDVARSYFAQSRGAPEDSPLPSENAPSTEHSEA